MQFKDLIKWYEEMDQKKATTEPECSLLSKAPGPGYITDMIASLMRKEQNLIINSHVPGTPTGVINWDREAPNVRPKIYPDYGSLVPEIIRLSREAGLSEQLLDLQTLHARRVNRKLMEAAYGNGNLAQDITRPDFTPGPYDIEIEDTPPIMASPYDIEL